MSEQTIVSFVKERIAGEIKKPSSWVADDKVNDGLSDKPWEAEDIAAEAVAAGITLPGMTWESLLAEVTKIMEA